MYVCCMISFPSATFSKHNDRISLILIRCKLLHACALTIRSHAGSHAERQTSNVTITSCHHPNRPNTSALASTTKVK